MTQVQDAIADLARIANELNDLSNKLAEVERRLEPLEVEYRAFLEDFGAAAWNRYETGEVKRFPGEKTLEALGRTQMEPELKVRYDTLMASRRRIKERINVLKATSDARRSILSAEKTLAEVT